MGFVGKHFFLRAAGAFALLAADALNFIAARGNKALLPFFNFVQQQAPGDEAVESLLARGLAFHLQAGGAMQQHDAG